MNTPIEKLILVYVKVTLSLFITALVMMHWNPVGVLDTVLGLVASIAISTVVLHGLDWVVKYT